MPGIVLRPGQRITTKAGYSYTLLRREGSEWLCRDCEGCEVQRSPAFLRRHGVRLEWTRNDPISPTNTPTSTP